MIQDEVIKQWRNQLVEEKKHRLNANTVIPDGMDDLMIQSLSNVPHLKSCIELTFELIKISFKADNDYEIMVTMPFEGIEGFKHGVCYTVFHKDELIVADWNELEAFTESLITFLTE